MDHQQPQRSLWELQSVAKSDPTLGNWINTRFLLSP